MSDHCFDTTAGLAEYKCFRGSKKGLLWYFRPICTNAETLNEKQSQLVGRKTVIPPTPYEFAGCDGQNRSK